MRFMVENTCSTLGQNELNLAEYLSNGIVKFRKLVRRE